MVKPACYTVGILVGVDIEVTLVRGLVGDIMLGGGRRCPRGGGGGGCPQGGAKPTHQGGTIWDQLVVWESWLQTLQTWSRSLPHVSLWLSTNQNLELRNFLSVRPPLYGKKQVAFK